MFKINPTSTLPPPLTPNSLYAIPLGAPFPPATAVGPNAYGRIVSAVDTNLCQALNQPGCFDVYDLTFDSDDGPGFLVVDHDVPSE